MLQHQTGDKLNLKILKVMTPLFAELLINILQLQVLKAFSIFALTNESFSFIWPFEWMMMWMRSLRKVEFRFRPTLYDVMVEVLEKVFNIYLYKVEKDIKLPWAKRNSIVNKLNIPWSWRVIDVQFTSWFPDYYNRNMYNENGWFF